MTDENLTSQTSENELEELKTRADQMGLKYHPSIGLDKLREKVNAHLSATSDEPEETNTPVTVSEQTAITGTNTTEPLKEAEPPQQELQPKVETDQERRIRLKKEANTLVRVRVTCMNPAKREWDGEIFTVANSVVGTIKKMVPFDTIWHVPQFILNHIESSQYQTFYKFRDPRTGQETRRGKLVKEFAIERLPELSEAQLHDLAQRQAMAQGTAAAAA